MPFKTLVRALPLMTLTACAAGHDEGEAEQPSQDMTTQGAALARGPAPRSRHLRELPDAVKRHEQRRADAAPAPAPASALTRMQEQRLAHGLGADHTFEVRSVNEDELGSKHVRLSQRYKGLRVLGATAIVHLDRSGQVSGEDVDSLQRNIELSTQPKLSPREAEAVVSARSEHRRDYLIPPRTELVIFPIKARFVKETGARVTGEEQGLNALDVERRTIGYTLAYQIDTAEEGEHEPLESLRYIVDANTGEVLSVKSLAVSEAGTGKSFKNDGPAGDFRVPIDTTRHVDGNLVWFEPRDAFRDFGVWDDDACESCGANQQFWNNEWGDFNAFAGDSSASKANRQTAIVDGLYGMQVTWDMFKNVFGRYGYDNHFYSGHAYVHCGTDWDDAAYYYLSGNICVGDSLPTHRSSRTHINTIGHEFGHGLNDFTADLGGNSEGEGLNEANSDIIGEIAEAYERGNGQVERLNFIPSSPPVDFVSAGSGRSFKSPRYRYWTTYLADLPDEHDRAQPMDHAFFFLSEGSVTDPLSPQFSTDVPWGMKGIGIHKAARIWIHALLAYMHSETDYESARYQCMRSAAALFGSGSPEYKATMNAFAAIGVGDPAPDYPAEAPRQGEAEPNNTLSSANPVNPANPPPGAPLTGPSLRRTLVVGNVTSSDVRDYFSVFVPTAKTLRLTLVPLNDNDLYLYDAAGTLVASSARGGDAMDQVVYKELAGGRTYKVEVKWYANVNIAPLYTLYFDIF